MVVGVGVSTFSAELARMTPMTDGVAPIVVVEYESRIAKAQRLMREQGIEALYLDSSTNLRYFTGVVLGLTERLHGALIPAQGRAKDARTHEVRH
jgi:Xaa-Pro dipeptidase